MQLSNLQTAILSIIVIAVLVFAGWAIRDKSRRGATVLPEFVQGARPQ